MKFTGFLLQSLQALFYRVFSISLLKLAIKGVPLEKKIKINTDKDKYNI